MSHFTVLVITSEKPTEENQLLEKALQPFHEFECTGHNDEYVQDVDETSEYLAELETETLEEVLSSNGMEDRVVSEESQVDRDGAHKYGYVVVSEGKLVKAVRRTNPNKQWDWWMVGGRWSGFFTPKSGAEFSVGEPSLVGIAMGQRVDAEKADMIRKGDVDFEAMRNTCGENTGERWDEVRGSVGDLTGYVSWPEVRDSLHPNDIGAAREHYGNQPQVKAFRQCKYGGPLSSLDEYTMTREEAVAKARNDALTTFAVLKDGKWVERGRMGWWGTVCDEKDSEEWASEFNKMLDELPDSDWLTLVDCHI